MSRWIAAALVIGVALVLSFAQEQPKDPPLRFPFGGSKSQLPFDVIELDGKKAWRIVGRGNIKIEELIAGYTTATGKRVTFSDNGAQYSRTTVPYIGPDDAMTIPNAELGDYVAELLESAGVTLVGHSTSKARVVRLDEAIGFAHVIEPSELASLPESEWVTIAYVDLQTDPRGLRQLFQPFTKAGTYIVTEENTMTASGRVAQIRNIEKLVTKLESSTTGSSGMQIRSYELGTINVATAVGTLNQLFEESSSSINMIADGYTVNTNPRKRINVSAVQGTTRLLVRATAGDHELVEAALAAMK